MAGYTNKMFLTNTNLHNATMVSRSKVNREYLISQSVADELNTYRTFGPFATFNDLFPAEYNDKGEDVTDDTKARSGAPGVRSIFNKSGAVLIGGNNATVDAIIKNESSEWRISNNVPLMDNRETRKSILRNNKCTIKDLVQASENGELGRETYAFSDFMYCKYLGKIPNNYLITLRRFPYPVDDYISSIGRGKTRRNKLYQTQNVDSMGCLVTWMGTPGNEMSNILKYSMAMPFKEQTAGRQSDEIDADSAHGPLPAIAALFDPTYRRQYHQGKAGAVVNDYIKQFFPNSVLGDPPYPASQWSSYTNNTKVSGPVDTIRTTYMRSSEGLRFDQNITLTFDYELRAYNGINGRQAMLDLLSNILNVTYTTGSWWAGGYRAGGAHQNNIFANLKIFKVKGGLHNFVDAFNEDVSTVTKIVKSNVPPLPAAPKIEKGKDTLETIRNAAGAVVDTAVEAFKSFSGSILDFLGTGCSMAIAGILNRLGRPRKAMVNSLLSPAPIGFWHLTIGNPHSPIMSIGNMVLKNTTVEHYGPLGLDDFPTGIKVTCELTRGKPRDIRDIEKLYMHGNDRIYTPMGPKIFDMYKHSKEYKNNDYKNPVQAIGDADAEIKVGDSTTVSTTTIKIEDIEKMKGVLQKYFGHADTYSISVASMEQDFGSAGKKKKGTGGGNSSLEANK